MPLGQCKSGSPAGRVTIHSQSQSTILALKIITLLPNKLLNLLYATKYYRKELLFYSFVIVKNKIKNAAEINSDPQRAQGERTQG